MGWLAVASSAAYGRPAIRERMSTIADIKRAAMAARRYHGDYTITGNQLPIDGIPARGHEATPNLTGRYRGGANAPSTGQSFGSSVRGRRYWKP